METKKVFAPLGLIDYQQASVVSREIVKKDEGRVSVFAFDKGEGLSEHIAPFDALVYTLEGKADVKVDGDSFTLRSGEALIIPANRSHSLKAIAKFKMLLVMIKA
ncbi:MAG: cupin domain-containing protein [Candidatus Omnitrophica bacterium]|nr:cupin domain-containing protein [Candidatus Omnitrophota bacterium]MBD3268836.1 cupin domain-containing protein [Candidatus Omnitrophota bacterium]